MHFVGLGGCLFSAICVLDAVDVVFVGGLSLLLVVLNIGLRDLVPLRLLVVYLFVSLLIVCLLACRVCVGIVCVLLLVP